MEASVELPKLFKTESRTCLRNATKFMVRYNSGLNLGWILAVFCIVRLGKESTRRDNDGESRSRRRIWCGLSSGSASP